MATLTLTISPDLEQRLREIATQQGIDPASYILNLLQQRLNPPSSTPTEAELLAQINIGLSQNTWEHYHTLIAKRQAEQLSSTEQAELIAISEEIEQANTQRIQALITLAEQRGISLETVMVDLGIESPAYG
ncbi:MAG: hypothetical protein AAF215_01460 [Cyanobacteria bacterium P01_A01_bin.123]